ncbi:unnamed protein product [Amaranthus hypochondriacus]
MGIKDLLRFLKPYAEPIHIHKFAGKRVGIDAYSWLHKGAYSCSMELCLNSEGDKKLQYINYFMHRINLLRFHEITPVVVFDGGNIPCKAATENDRYRRRKANKELAMEKLKQGNVNAAIELFQRAISITPSMAHLLIQSLKSENVEFIVAPYEADAQLAYMSSLGEEHGGIAAVISEDSDLLAYGCPSVVFKMDKFGNGEEIVLENILKSTNSKPSFRKFTTSLFTDMCVLAGCDFLPSIPGIGISKAHALVSKYQNINRVISVLKIDKGKQVPEDYARSFKEAVSVFQHATIYNRHTKCVEHMKELPEKLLESLGELDFLGPYIPPTIATAIAEGKLDPSTMEAYDCSLSHQTSHSAQTFASVQQIRKCHMTGEVEEIVQTFDRKNYKVQGDKEKQTNSCFTLFSSGSMTDNKVSNKSTTIVERQVLKERNFNFSNEATNLSKLVDSSEIHCKEEISMVSEDFPVKTPDNNPFRKRKHHSENTESTPASKLVRSSETQIHFNDGCSTVSDEFPVKTPVNNPFQKRRHQSDNAEFTPTATKSSVTDDDHLNLKSQNVNSQESVNSKLRKLQRIPEQVKVMTKRNSKNSKISGNKNGKSTILNFFSRI